MRLPRVRISMGMLTLVVAVAAADCAVVRLIYEKVQNYHGGSPLHWVTNGFAVGFLPLANVTLIGGLLFAARRLRSWRRGDGTHPRPAPASFTFLCLHVLALSGVVVLFNPGLFGSYLELCDPATSRVREAGTKFFARLGDPFPFLVLESVMYAVLLSGPLLLLAGIGAILARMCAARLPGWRFRTLAGVVTIGFASVAFAVAATFRPFSEEQDVPLAFQVVDQDTGTPIGAAFVCIADPFRRDSTSAPRSLTGSDGRVNLSDRFEASGERSAFRTVGTYSPWGRWLEISATGYQPLRIPLTQAVGAVAPLDRRLPLNQAVGPVADLDRSSRPHRVSLARGAKPEGPFREVAGRFSCRMGMGGGSFQIEPDGRFAFTASSCTSSEQEYGYLKWNDGEIELLPITQPGERPNPWTKAKYRAIRWGDRLYLSSTEADDIRSICRSALSPSRLGRYVPYGLYLRESDDKKPIVGRPQLPAKVWMAFLRDELDLRNQAGSLRVALGSLIPSTPRSGPPQSLDDLLDRLR